MKNPTIEDLQWSAEAAIGRRRGSLLLKNSRVANVFTLELEHASVLIAGSLIAGVGPDFTDADAETVVDLKGAILSPGLIDGHLHIESSLVTPAEYESAVLCRGVTGIVADPHEVANVAGVAAIEWMIQASENLQMDVWFAVPSSVPATPMETSGAILTVDDIDCLLAHPRVVAIGELMNVPGFVNGDLQELQKSMLTHDKPHTAEGHAPGLMGRALQAYLGSGISSDHESTTLEEGLQKLQSGCFLMIREGSATRNLQALMPLVNPRHGDRIGLVTDDRLPHDLIVEGGVDFAVRKAIALGADPIYAVRCASWNTARHFRLQRRGAIAAGYFADLVICDRLEGFTANDVIKDGQFVSRQSVSSEALSAPESIRHSVRLPDLKLSNFEITARSGNIRVIEAIPNQILTRERIFAPTIVDGLAVADSDKDLAKLVCVERHGHHGKVAKGFASGFGLREGVLACSVAHDHHNCLAVGMNDADMLFAFERLQSLGGGLVVVNKGQVLAELSLPIFGLLSDQPLEAVHESLVKIDQTAKSLGCMLPSQIMALSFLGLEVIPELRLTDLGLVDVVRGEFVDLWV
jgi:adenine deaminase